MEETQKPEVGKKFDKVIAALKKIGLKPLFNTTSPRDMIYGVECCRCKEFWAVYHQPTHEKTCANPHRKLDSKEIQKIIADNT